MVGGLLGGFLGESLGLHNTILIAGIGALVSGVWVALSPVTKATSIPQEWL